MKRPNESSPILDAKRQRVKGPLSTCSAQTLWDCLEHGNDNRTSSWYDTFDALLQQIAQRYATCATNQTNKRMIHKEDAIRLLFLLLEPCVQKPLAQENLLRNFQKPLAQEQSLRDFQNSRTNSGNPQDFQNSTIVSPADLIACQNWCQLWQGKSDVDFYPFSFCHLPYTIVCLLKPTIAWPIIVYSIENILEMADDEWNQLDPNEIKRIMSNIAMEFCVATFERVWRKTRTQHTRRFLFLIFVSDMIDYSSDDTSVTSLTNEMKSLKTMDELWNIQDTTTRNASSIDKHWIALVNTTIPTYIWRDCDRDRDGSGEYLSGQLSGQLSRRIVANVENAYALLTLGHAFDRFFLEQMARQLNLHNIDVDHPRYPQIELRITGILSNCVCAGHLKGQAQAQSQAQAQAQSQAQAQAQADELAFWYTRWNPLKPMELTDNRLTPLEFLLAQFLSHGTRAADLYQFAKATPFRLIRRPPTTYDISLLLSVICKYDTRMIDATLHRVNIREPKAVESRLDILLRTMTHFRLADDVQLWKRVWSNVSLPHHHPIYQDVFARSIYIQQQLKTVLDRDVATLIHEYV
jgi:hypothetical protein